MDKLMDMNLTQLSLVQASQTIYLISICIQAEFSIDLIFILYIYFLCCQDIFKIWQHTFHSTDGVESRFDSWISTKSELHPTLTLSHSRLKTLWIDVDYKVGFQYVYLSSHIIIHNMQLQNADVLTFRSSTEHLQEVLTWPPDSRCD